MTNWTIDTIHSSASFEVAHMGISTYRGRFRVMTGTAVLDGQPSVKASIDVKSIDVEPGPLLTKLLDPDFFDVANHPTLSFESTSFQGNVLAGNLTLRGVTRPVTFEVKALGEEQNPFYQKTMRAFSASGSINRGDFGLKWNAPLGSGGQYLGERVTITLQVELLAEGTK